MASRPPVYYINLAGRTDRRDFMERQFVALGLAATRIDAMPTAELAPALLTQYSDLRKPHYLTPPEVACASSHLRAWQAFLDAPDAPEWGLILEDDGILSEQLPGFLDEFLAAAETIPVDILQLETRNRAVRVLPASVTLPSGRRLAPFRSARDGGACYLISRRAALTLLARDDLFHQPIDLTIFRPFTWPGRAVRTLLVEPALCIQLDQVARTAPTSHSNLRASRRLKAGERWGAQARLRVLNFVDHVAHLPAGVRRRVIAFDGDLARWR